MRLGLLAGVAFALVKLFRPKPDHQQVLDLGSAGGSLGGSQWPPLQAAVPTPEPIQVPQPEVAPVVQTEEPGLVTIGDEPLQEPVAETPPAAAPAKKAAKARATKKAAPATGRVAVTWVDPVDNICPKSHPVKGKMSSMIFQIPGNFAYDRTNPDRCYESAAAASADGLRPAKR
jgi:hypothetical protein